MAEDVSVSPNPNLHPRDRALRARVLTLSPRERLVAMQRLIDDAWATLQLNPVGLAHYRRRNFRARSIRRPPELRSHGT